MIKNFADVLDEAKKSGGKRVAVAAAHDDAVLEAVKDAKGQGIAEFVLVGDSVRIKELAAAIGLSLDGCEVVHEPDDRKAAYLSVTLVSSGKADILMKGLLNTADLLRAVLDKEVGLRTGRVLSHIYVYELPQMDRLLLLTDAAVNIAPTLKEKADIIQNSVIVANSLGINPAKVAVLAAVETVNPNMPVTIDAAALAKMAERRQIKGAIIDGPLAFDNAVSVEAARHKGIDSPVAGLADILMVPDIEAGNMLAKSLNFFAGGRIGGVVLGTTKPVVLTSRADTHETKLLSIALSTLIK
jgi:phosphate butyryltransferase